MDRWIVIIEIAAPAAGSGSPNGSDASEPSPSRRIVHGAQHDAIDLVAATADDRAVVTQDADGDTRLWPTLDETAEPILLRIAAAAELASSHELLTLRDDQTIEAIEGERRCGWQFGLVTTKLERSANAVSVCDAE